jgi:hypothetical protein
MGKLNMSVQLAFNAQTVAPAENSFDMIPAGWYRQVVEKAELKPTKAGTGSYISLQVRIQGQVDTGEHANRVVFGNINYTNPNPEAQDIGQRQLSALCHAIGVMNLSSVEQLCGIPHEGRIKQGKATYNTPGDASSGVAFEARNEIQGFRALGGGAPAAGAAATTSAPAKPAAPVAPVSKPAPVAPAQAAPVTEQAAPETETVAPVDTAAAVTAPAQPW